MNMNIKQTIVNKISSPLVKEENIDEFIVYLHDLSNKKYYKVLITDDILQDFIGSYYCSILIGIVIHHCFTDDNGNIMDNNMTEISEDKEINEEEEEYIIDSFQYGFIRTVEDLCDELIDDKNIEYLNKKLLKYRNYSWGTKEEM